MDEYEKKEVEVGCPETQVWAARGWGGVGWEERRRRMMAARKKMMVAGGQGVDECKKKEVGRGRGDAKEVEVGIGWTEWGRVKKGCLLKGVGRHQGGGVRKGAGDGRVNREKGLVSIDGKGGLPCELSA